VLEHAAAFHLFPELEPLARSLADPSKDGNALQPLNHVVDELCENDGLADAGAPKDGRAAARQERAEQVDDLDETLMPVG